MPHDVLMATKMTVVDDLDGSEPASTVSFALGNISYEIDLSNKNKAAMEKKLSKFTDAARKVSTSGRSRPARSNASRSDSVAIREWAKSNGHKVSERGRIAANVVKAYLKDHT